MSIKYLLIVCLVLAIIPQTVLCQDVDVQDLMTYNKWRFSNKRVYMNEDEQIYRQSVFFDNLKKIASHEKNKEATYTVGLNQFSDMSEEEFASKILNSNLSQEQSNTTSKRTDGEDEELFDAPRSAGYGAPQSVDWRTKGVVTAIKNQGQCGSCWTFATAGVLESLNAIKGGKLTTFAEQQLLDCVTPAYGYRSNGCGGGYPEQAFAYVQRVGILQSQQYPYIGYQGQCRVAQYANQVIGFRQSRYQRIAQNPEALKTALAYAPVQVAVNASTWQNYRGGVFNGCGQYTYQQQLNHAVVVVGYDAQGNWIVKNSFGTQWGEAGYMRLAPGNTCGALYDNIQAI